MLDTSLYGFKQTTMRRNVTHCFLRLVLIIASYPLEIKCFLLRSLSWSSCPSPPLKEADKASSTSSRPRRHEDGLSFQLFSTRRGKQQQQQKRESEGEGGGEEEEEEGEISDAEALLACWSYLNKRKRMGNWTQFERRKAMKAAVEPTQFFLELQDLEVENPDLLYENLDEWDESELKDGADGNDSITQNQDDSGIDTAGDATTTGGGGRDEIWYGEFTSYTSTQSSTRIRKSQAMKRLWSDPEFRKRWYNKRWGKKLASTASINAIERKKEEELSKKRKIMRRRVRALPTGFLSSPELASMTEAEIDEAIKTYRQGRKQQAKSRASTLAVRKKKLLKKPPGGEQEEDDTQQRLPRDSLFAVDKRKLEHSQRKRSELAQKAYKTRLKNNPKDEVAPPKANAALLPSKDAARPQDAMIRIEADLSRGVNPRVDDVKLVMKPQKMRKRRDILRRILSDIFDLRGRCIPFDLKNPEADEKQFATQASIVDVGNYVIYLLEIENNNKQK